MLKRILRMLPVLAFVLVLGSSFASRSVANGKKFSTVIYQLNADGTWTLVTGTPPSCTGTKNVCYIVFDSSISPASAKAAALHARDTSPFFPDNTNDVVLTDIDPNTTGDQTVTIKVRAPF